MTEQPVKIHGREFFEAEDNKCQDPKLDVHLTYLDEMNKEKSVGKRSEKVGEKEMRQQHVTYRS